MKENSLVYIKSKAFAIRIVGLYKYLCDNKEFIISKQVLRSGTSIGANLAEAKFAQSNADFINKISIALKETSETEYWLELLFETDYITKKQYESIRNDCSEICKMLISTVKTLKNK